MANYHPSPSETSQAETGEWESSQGRETMCVCLSVSVCVCVPSFKALGSLNPNPEHLARS